MMNKRMMLHSTNSRHNLNNTFQYFSILVISVILLSNPVSTVAAGKKVTVIDHGLNMPMATYIIPNGWKLDADIATDPNTGQYARYKMDKYGPNGEITRSLPPISYGPMQGKNFQQAWQQAAQHALSDLLQNTNFGQPHQNDPAITKMKNDPRIQQSMQQLGVRDITAVDFSGKRNGKGYEGKLVIVTAPTGQQSGMLIMGIALSPPGLLMKTIETDLKIGASSQANPQHNQAVQQISQRVMQGMQARHQQQMQTNQQQFNAHQKMMQGRYQNSDQQNQQWMNNFRNDGSGGTGNNGYSSHDAYIDSIHEQSTFHDPDSGQNVTRDGQYDRNYTDGMGGYYGTDDPSFNPNSMPGNWQETEPLHPNY